MEPVRRKLIIIGAGAAGLAAGTNLLSAGIDDFIVLEAELRIGGRIHTVEIDGAVVDLGAQYCHGQSGNAVWELASAYQLLEPSLKGSSNMGFILSNGKILEPYGGERLLAACLNFIGSAKNHPISPLESLGDYVTAEFDNYVKNEAIEVAVDDKEDFCWSFFEWFQRFQNAIDGADSWFDSSLLGHSDYKECKGNAALNWKGTGYSRILDIMMKKFPDPSLLLPIEPRIHIGKEVFKIEWDDGAGGPATLHCSDGSKYLAEKVLLTVSLGVLKDRFQDLFVPQLPDCKQLVIKGLAMGSVNKILLSFEEAWWPESYDGFSFIWSKKETEEFKIMYAKEKSKKWLLDLFGFYQYYGQRNVLCGWVVGESARIMEECSEDEVRIGCLELLQKFVGGTYQISPIKSLIRSQWYSNRNFRGSYSYRNMDGERQGSRAAHLAEPVCNSQGHEVLLFAGEATHSDYFSTVHGAIDSGWREAERLKAFFGDVA